MILIDANLLIYAYDASSPRHSRARAWLEEALSGPEPVRLALATILAFLRITTHSAVFERPFTVAEAVERVDAWLEQPGVSLLQPSERHWRILRRLLPAAQARGALVTDAHLAALAIEHGAVLCTTDRDFRRFDDLTVVDPLG